MRTKRRVVASRTLVIMAFVSLPQVSVVQSAASSCLVSRGDALAVSASPVDPMEYPAYKEWIANPTADSQLQAIDQALKDVFGGAAGSADGLKGGLIGLAADDTTRTEFAVVDAAQVDVPQVESTLRAVANEAVADNAAGQLSIEVIASCNSATELLAAREILQAVKDSRFQGNIGYGWGLDPHTSTWAVNIDPSSPLAEDLATWLRGELGELMTLEWTSIELTGRLEDGEPHYGGAGIHPVGFTSPPSEGLNGNTCTSAFTVNLPGGGLGGTTAAHCFDQSGYPINDRSVKSGDVHYGQTVGASSYSTYDLVRIAPEGDDFDPKIHTTPCCPSVRTITGAGDPIQTDSNICISGMVTLAVCGGEVSMIDTTQCFFGQPDCTIHMFKIHHDSNNMCQFMDSGAPVYERVTGSSNAKARGMLIGGSGPRNCFAHLWSAIRDHLNVTIAT